jgi:protein involved in polysaccharide export with SLBB domain
MHPTIELFNACLQPLFEYFGSANCRSKNAALRRQRSTRTAWIVGKNPHRLLRRTFLVWLVLVASNSSLLAQRSNRSLDSRTQPNSYRLDTGDMLAIMLYGVLDHLDVAPTHFPSRSDPSILPASGHPIVVTDRGTIVLPQIPPVFVRGLDVGTARKKIAEAYITQKILTNEYAVMLSLLRKRTIRATIIHQSSRASTNRVESVVIEGNAATTLGALAAANSFDLGGTVQKIDSTGSRRANPSETIANNAILKIESDDVGQFFTGGLLAGGVYPVSSRESLTLTQAIAVAGGAKNAGFFGPSRVIVIPQNGSSQSIPYRQVLATPNAYYVHPGDTILLK